MPTRRTASRQAHSVAHEAAGQSGTRGTQRSSESHGVLCEERADAWPHHSVGHTRDTVGPTPCMAAEPQLGEGNKALLCGYPLPFNGSSRLRQLLAFPKEHL